MHSTSRISVILHTILHTFLRTFFFDYINMITQISNNSKFYMFTIIYTIAFTVCFCFDFIFLLSIYFSSYKADRHVLTVCFM